MGASGISKSVFGLTLGNFVRIRTIFQNADGDPLPGVDKVTFAARPVRGGDEITFDSTDPRITDEGDSTYVTRHRPESGGRWYWRIEARNASNEIIGADEGRFDVISRFD